MKEVTLGLAVTLSALIGQQTAHAQETPMLPETEADAVPPIAEPTSKPSLQAEASLPKAVVQVTIEPTPTIEFSSQTIELPQALSTSLEPQSATQPETEPESQPKSRTRSIATAELAIVPPQVSRQIPEPLVSVTRSQSTGTVAAQTFTPTESFPDSAPAESIAPNSLQEKIQRLEQQQQQLQQELEQLRQQVGDSQAKKLTPHPDRPQGLSVFSEAVFIKPRTSDLMDFARVNDSFNSAVGGELATLDYDQSTAWRVGFSYAPKDSAWDFGASHTFFSADAQGSATEPTRTDGTPGRLLATYAHPFQNQRATNATAEAKLGYGLTDLEVGYTLRPSSNLNVRLFAGLQIARLDQSTDIRYNGQDFSPNGGTVNLVNNFNGVGPKLGGEVRVMLGSGFSVFGRGSAAMLFGKSQFRYQETFGTDTVANLNFDRQQTLPVMNFAIGLDWTGKLSQTTQLSLGVGYEYQHWFNATRDIRFVDDASPAIFTERRGDLSLQGFFVRAGVSIVF